MPAKGKSILQHGLELNVAEGKVYVYTKLISRTRKKCYIDNSILYIYHSFGYILDAV